MEVTKTLSRGKLTGETREYLLRIWRDKGRVLPGEYFAMVGGRIGAGRLIFGVGCLLAAAWNLNPEHLFESTKLEAILLTVGICLMVWRVRRWVALIKGKEWADFRFLDGTWFWETRGSKVQVTRLAEAQNIQVFEKSVNGERVESIVQVTLPGGPWSAAFKLSEDACRFGRFLEAAVSLRHYARGNMAPSEVTDHLRTDGGLAQGAAQLLQSNGAGLGLDPRAVVPIPTPEESKQWTLDGAGLVWWIVLPIGLWVMLLFGLPSIRYAIDHDYTYQRVLQSATSDVYTPREYLERFPIGAHRQGVKDLLDDRLFDVARSNAEIQRSPVALREYLGSEFSGRHQKEALELIAPFYDEAITNINRLVDSGAKERDFLMGLVELLEFLKEQLVPRVRVAFHSDCIVEPRDPEVRTSEREFETHLRRIDPVIEEICRRSGSSIVEPYRAFSDEQIRSREKLVLAIFRESLSPILSSDILELTRVEGNEGDIVIHYDIRPVGDLRVYRMRREGSAPSVGGVYPDSSVKTIGTLREFRISWKLALAPGGRNQRDVYKTDSHAVSQIDYQSTPEDPDWAVYSVMMYSNFYDFASRILTGAGLPGKKAPDAFRFIDTQ